MEQNFDKIQFEEDRIRQEIQDRNDDFGDDFERSQFPQYEDFEYRSGNNI